VVSPVPTVKPLQFGEPASAASPSIETLNLLMHRRSTPAGQLGPDGPSEAELSILLQIASRVPDHGKLAPWRFLIFSGESRSQAGALLKSALLRIEPEADDERAAFEAGRFERAPVVIAVISSPVLEHKIPEWEQVLSAGAVCQSLLIAAHAMGFAGQWLTEWYAYDRALLDALGLDAHEKVAGFIYLGSAPEESFERARPDMGRIISWYGKN
jgi:nitroreductase